jgi:hypothetical protein
MLGNLIRSTLLVGIAGLVGWYNYEVNALVGLITNACFLALGILLVSTWKRTEPKEPSPVQVVDTEDFFQRIDERMELYMEARESEPVEE